MSTNNFSVFPSTKMLPMDDIAQELKIIHNFSTADQKAIDTLSVAGAPSSNIAVVALDENGDPLQYTDSNNNIIIDERETVKNALFLKGVPAENFLTKEQAEIIKSFGENVAKTYSDEIASLRDELYQLRGELTRSGFVHEYGLYAGFQDFFKTSNKKYLCIKKEDGTDTIELCGLSPNTVNSPNMKKIIPSKTGIIKVGDWFMLGNKLNGKTYVVKATKVELITSEEEVTFETPISPEGIPDIGTISDIVITKIHGDYFNGSFSFSQIEKNAVTGKERYTMLNDDTVTEYHKLNENKKGYSTTFRVPLSASGALKSFFVTARTVGLPGALTCYVMNKDVDISTITNLELEKESPNNKILAVSKPFIRPSNSSTDKGIEIEFDFKNPITDKYPMISGGSHYCFVIVAETGSNTDFWEIQFSKYKNHASTSPDVQTNNSTHTYRQGIGFSESDLLGDMIFVLTTIGVEENAEIPRTSGLYTSQKIDVHYNSSLSRARLSLRINKEGMLTSATSGDIHDNGTIMVSTDSKSHPEHLGIKANDVIVIGNQIRTARTDSSLKTISIDKAVSVNKTAPIYRVGYKVYLRAIKRTWIEGANPRYEITSDICIPMTLKAVMTDDYKLNNHYSDRLIFECEFRDANQLPIDANQFELQIVWNSNATVSDLVANENYIGRIHDLNLSFDRTL